MANDRSYDVIETGRVPVKAWTRGVPIEAIIYQPEWRPTLRWAARVLGVYAMAALCGGMLFVIYTLLFVPP